jgi:hypothetical protein
VKTHASQHHHGVHHRIATIGNNMLNDFYTR